MIRRYGERRRRVLSWVSANAIAWAGGHVLGEQVLASGFGHLPLGNSPFWEAIALLLIEATTWLVIGMVTGAVLIRLADPRESA